MVCHVELCANGLIWIFALKSMIRLLPPKKNQKEPHHPLRLLASKPIYKHLKISESIQTPKLETRTPKLETRNPKLETWNLKLET